MNRVWKDLQKNWYLNYLISQSFQGVNMLFVLSFENEDGRTSHSTYYLAKVEIKDYNVMIDHTKILEELLPLKEMTIQLVVYLIILTSMKTTKWLQ